MALPMLSMQLNKVRSQIKKKNKMGILIVEDSAFQARILTDLLWPLNAAILTASTPEEASKIIEDVRISLVVTDLYMPRKQDGLDFIKYVKTSENCVDTEVFVCTFDEDMSTTAELNAIGVRHIFYKPYDPKEMLSLMKKTVL